MEHNAFKACDSHIGTDSHHHMVDRKSGNIRGKRSQDGAIRNRIFFVNRKLSVFPLAAMNAKVSMK